MYLFQTSLAALKHRPPRFLGHSSNTAYNAFRSLANLSTYSLSELKNLSHATEAMARQKLSCILKTTYTQPDICPSLFNADEIIQQHPHLIENYLTTYPDHPYWVHAINNTINNGQSLLNLTHPHRPFLKVLQDHLPTDKRHPLTTLLLAQSDFDILGFLDENRNNKALFNVFKSHEFQQVLNRLTSFNAPSIEIYMRLLNFSIIDRDIFTIMILKEPSLVDCVLDTPDMLTDYGLCALVRQLCDETPDEFSTKPTIPPIKNLDILRLWFQLIDHPSPFFSGQTIAWIDRYIDILESIKQTYQDQSSTFQLANQHLQLLQHSMDILDTDIDQKIQSMAPTTQVIDPSTIQVTPNLAGHCSFKALELNLAVCKKLSSENIPFTSLITGFQSKSGADLFLTAIKHWRNQTKSTLKNHPINHDDLFISISNPSALTNQNRQFFDYMRHYIQIRMHSFNRPLKHVELRYKKVNKATQLILNSSNKNPITQISKLHEKRFGPLKKDGKWGHEFHFIFVRLMLDQTPDLFTVLCNNGFGNSPETTVGNYYTKPQWFLWDESTIQDNLEQIKTIYFMRD